jgi:hypothetical protein
MSPGQARRDRPDHQRLCTRAEMTLDHGPSGNEAWPNSCPPKTMAQGKPGAGHPLAAEDTSFRESIWECHGVSAQGV